jgi:nitric oxide reductase activation protein
MDDIRKARLKKYLGERDTAINGLSAIADSRKDRFGLFELEDAVNSFSDIHGDASLVDFEAMVEVSSERLTMADEWRSPSEFTSVVRGSVITHPQPKGTSGEKYCNLLTAVQNHVNSLRALFRLRLSSKRHCDTELVQGALHKRMLSRATLTPRIFKRDYQKEVPGVALCVLLDESGSMGSAATGLEKTKAVTAAQIAVLFAEALDKIPNVELEIYSFTSCGDAHKDNAIKYLYGKNNLNKMSITGYSPGAQNYDHIALKVAGDMFVTNTKNSNRIMFVVSDGEPLGIGYKGPATIEATKKAVAALERRGIFVLGVAIEAFAIEDIYTKHVKFLDMGSLVSDMQKLLVSFISKSSTY